MMTPLFVLTALVAAASSAALPGTCPDPPAVLNFNAAAMEGLWFDQLHTPRRSGLELKCDLLKIRVPRTSHLTLTSYTYSSATKKIIGVSGEADVPGSTGVLQVRVPSLKLNGGVRVLSTDYTTFAVLWTCNSRGGSHEERALVLTREKNPSAALIAAAVKVLENNNLERKDLSDTRQHKCHDYDLNAQGLSDSLGGVTSLGSLLSVHSDATTSSSSSISSSTSTTTTTTAAPATTAKSGGGIASSIGGGIKDAFKKITG